jgi:hypothetical protein
MYSTTVYLYQQIVKVLSVDTNDGETFTYRYNPVYAKNLTVNKGVDNVLLFEFINQEEKPVNITGSQFVFRLLNQTGDQVLLEKNMSILSPTTGRAKVVLTPAETIDIVAQPASYSIQRSQGSYVEAVYVDANSQARANCDVVDSVLPQFLLSQELTIPDIYGKAQQLTPGPTNWPDWALQPPPVNTAQLTEFYSSHMPSNGQNLTTVQADLDVFTGTIKFQAAETYESVWYDVSESFEYFGESGTKHWNILGYHPLLRMALNTSPGYGAQAQVIVTESGVVTGVEITAQGQGYIGNPKVQILGNGAGAEAVVTGLTSTGGVAGVSIVSGGSGYLPIQYQSSQQATALFSKGYVQNIKYR